MVSYLTITKKVMLTGRTKMSLLFRVKIMSSIRLNVTKAELDKLVVALETCRERYCGSDDDNDNDKD